MATCVVYRRFGYNLQQWTQRYALMLQLRNLLTVAGVRDANGAVPSACGLCRSNGLREITSATLLCPDEDV